MTRLAELARRRAALQREMRAQRARVHEGARRMGRDAALTLAVGAAGRVLPKRWVWRLLAGAAAATFAARLLQRHPGRP